MTQQPAMAPARPRAARLVISEQQLGTLENLATGFAARNAELSELLLSKLARARIAPPERMPEDVVMLGTPTIYVEPDSGEARRVTLVPPAEADIARDRVSVMTPIGVALIGLPVGARACWQTRGGETRTLLLQAVERAKDTER